MYRKTFFLCLVVLAFVLANNCSALGQVAPLRGRVFLKQADGNKVPVADAQIDVFRTDLPGEFKTKTDKKGNFVFAGLPLTGTYIIAISAAGAQPQAQSGYKANDTEYTFELLPGDGRRLTKDEAKQYAAAGASQQIGRKETEEERKAREELTKKRNEIETANKKAEESNALYNKANSEGNAAFTAKKYDEAIASYDTALNADPNYPGAYTLQINKAIALRMRGADNYNAGVKATDDAEKKAKMDAGKQDFKASAEAAIKAIEQLKTIEPPTDQQVAANHKAELLRALSAKAEALRLVIKYGGESSLAEAGYNAFQEYIAAEIDPVRKAKAQLIAAELLLEGQLADRAYEEFKKLIDADPNNYDAYRGAGLSLFNLANEAKYQEAANYLQLFVDKAPDTHPDKASAKDALDYLKNEAKIKPQKITPTKKKGN
jgi:tetratricopeptide (TPR) repeat protein